MLLTLRSALRLSASAVRREAWLLALGLVVAGARRIATWPAVWAGVVLLVRGAMGAVLARPGDLAAPLDGALATATSSRFVGLVGGLWLSGALIAGALRVAWISGALSTLGARMAGAPQGAAGFAGGVAQGFARVLPAAVLGVVLELTGALFAATLVLASVLLLGHHGAAGGARVVGLSAATALALVLALLVPLALSTAADALVARAAVVVEGTGATLAAVAGRFRARPGAFLAGAMLFGAAGLAVQLAVQVLGNVATGFAQGAAPLVLLGPQLMIGAAAALLAGVVDLVWMGTVAVLAAGRAPGAPG